MIIDLPAPVAVVCHDAGAANHIVAWLRADGSMDSIQPYMAGPARKIWDDAFAGHTIMPSLSEAFAGARSLVSGTGWSSDLEHEARRLARELKLKSAAMVDHWVNYENRFVRNGEKILPDEIWVADEYAQAIAKHIFPACSLCLKEDAYSQQLLATVLPVAKVTQNQLLYVLEPMRADWARAVQGEFQALDYMLAHVPRLNLPSDTVIKLRPHPSDSAGKYDAYLSRKHQYSIELDQGSLMESISDAKWVAGCESFALTLALRAGRRVYCSLPPWAPSCRLPHSGLIHLKNLDAL